MVYTVVTETTDCHHNYDADWASYETNYNEIKRDSWKAAKQDFDDIVNSGDKIDSVFILDENNKTVKYWSPDSDLN